MALTCVEWSDGAAADHAAKLARQFGAPLAVPAAKPVAEVGVKLIVGSGGLSLGFMDKSKGKPYIVDFLTAAWKARFQQPLGRSHIFRRALGAHDQAVRVVDATAGFGQDAVLAASFGCTVTAIERSPVVAAVLRDGLDRAVREDVWMRTKLASLTLVQADAAEYLKALKPEQRPDVVYLDPMFSKPKKSAKSPKEMQLLQELLEPSQPEDEEKLLAAALAAAAKRVVVKRPLKARAVKSSPTHSYKGQSIRYDVYVK